MKDRSTLARLVESGLRVPRVRLRAPATEAVRERLAALPQDGKRHVLLGEISRDETGIVRRSRDVDLGRDVAMKLLRRSHLKSPEAVKRFVKEAQIAGRLQHPGIVSVYELGLRKGRRPYYTTRLVEGETLAAQLAAREETAAARRKLLAIFEQVCQTMAYAHAQGVVHCDLRPDNILVGPFGEVQVMGWGLARVLDHAGKGERDNETNESPEVCHHPWEGSAIAYRAPEQVRGGDADERSDVFALGMILCEVLTGGLPHATNGNALAKDARARLAACGADAELAALCCACLAAAPGDRPDDAGVVAEEVGVYVAAVEARTHRSELAAIEQRAQVERQRTRAEEARAVAEEHRRRRRQGLLVAAALLVAVLVGGVSWRAIESGREERARAVALTVDAQLEEAARLEGLGQWAGAVAAAELARELAQAEDASDGLRRQAADAVADLNEKWAGAREAARRNAETAALLRRLEEVRLLRADPERIDTAYAAAFDEFDIDVGNVVAASIGIRTRNRAAEVVAALDHWASLRRSNKGLPDPGRLIAIACDADPDSRRNEIRRTAGDPEALRGFVSRMDVAETSARTCGLLALLLMEVGDTEAAAELLREAVSAHPSDLWLNRDLAAAAIRVKRPRPEEPLRYLTAAVAVRPASAGLWRVRGTEHLRAGEFGDAAWSFQEAIALSWGGSPGDWLGCAVAHAGRALQNLRGRETGARGTSSGD